MPALNESIRTTLEYAHTQHDRFLLVGSYGRAAVLGDDLAEHASSFGQGRRFQDVDFIDTSGALLRKYRVPGGADFDSQLTKQVRPIDDDTWGLFDTYTSDEPPLVVVGAEQFVTQEIPIDTIGLIQTFGPNGQLALTHLIDFYRPFMKHSEQVKLLLEKSTYQGSDLEQAMDEYTAKMKEKYRTRTLYRLLQLAVATATPKQTLALSNEPIPGGYENQPSSLEGLETAGSI